MNLLLDTNILIDYMGRKNPFFQNAQKVIAAGFFGDARLWAPVQSFNDVFYVLRGRVDPADLLKRMDALCEIVGMVDLTSGDARKAMSLGWDDYEDCLVAVAAQKANANYLITRDVKGFDRSMVPAMTPEAWLDMMAAEKNTRYAEVAF